VLYRPLAPDVVRRSFRASATDMLGGETMAEIRQRIVSEIDGPRQAYLGGDKALEFLFPMPGETTNKKRIRDNLYHNVPLVRPISDTFGNLVYGDPYPTRSWYIGNAPPDIGTLAEALLAQLRAVRDGQELPSIPQEDQASAAFSTWAHGVYEENGVKVLFRQMVGGRVDALGRWGGGMLVDGGAALKVYPIRDDKNPGSATLGRVIGLKFAMFPIEDAYPLPDPDDPDFVMAWVEKRQFGEKHANRLWARGGFEWVDDGLNRIDTPPGAMPPGDLRLDMPPFVLLSRGGTMMRDAVYQQKSLINGYSSYDFVKLSQGRATPVQKGKQLNKPVATEHDGLRVKLAEDTPLILEKDGDFFFAVPQVPLDDHLQGIKALENLAYKTHGLPDLVNESNAAEQPWTMILRWFPALTVRKGIIPACHRFERDLAKVVTAYAAAYREDLGLPEFDPEAVGFDVQFADNPMPQMSGSDREKALRERWKDGAILTTQYLHELDPELSAQELAEKAFALEAERTRRQPAAPTVAPAPMMDPDHMTEPGGEPTTSAASAGA